VGWYLGHRGKQQARYRILDCILERFVWPAMKHGGSEVTVPMRQIAALFPGLSRARLLGALRSARLHDEHL